MFEGQFEEIDEMLPPIRKEIEKLYDVVIKHSIDDLDGLIPDIVAIVKNVLIMFNNIQNDFEFLLVEHDYESSLFFHDYKADIYGVEKSLNVLEEEIRNINAKKLVTFGMEARIRGNLIQNFQVSKLSNLRGKEDTLSEVGIQKFGKFEFSSSKIELNLNGVWLRESQRFPRFSDLIYLESPVYWKLKNALEDLRINPRYRHRERVRLSGIPGYFYDLASAFKHEYTGDIAFPDLYERLTGKDVLGGKIAISESGDLSFQENGRSFSLPVTAMGVANLGILALLIERKILDEDSFLFIDEPEATSTPGLAGCYGRKLYLI